MIPVLTTERLTLRAAEDRDLDAFAELWADEETTRYVGGIKTRAEPLNSFRPIVPETCSLTASA